MFISDIGLLVLFLCAVFSFAPQSVPTQPPDECLSGTGLASVSQLIMDFRNVASLQSLSLEDCGLEALQDCSFQGTALTHLDLSGNWGVLNGSIAPLWDVAPTLQVLSLRNVGLTSSFAELDFSAFENLRSLDLSGNALTSFPRFGGSLALQTLDLRRNLLTALPQRAVSEQLAGSLRTVYLSQNPYECCGVEDWGALHPKGRPERS